MADPYNINHRTGIPYGKNLLDEERAARASQRRQAGTPMLPQSMAPADFGAPSTSMLPQSRPDAAYMKGMLGQQEGVNEATLTNSRGTVRRAVFTDADRRAGAEADAMRGGDSGVTFRPTAQMGGAIGASIAAMSDEQKAGMRYDQFMRDLGRQRFGSARRAVADAYTGNERNLADQAISERRARTEENTEMTRANAGIGIANARGGLDAQAINTEAATQRRGQDMDYAAKTAPTPVTAKDLIELKKAQVDLAGADARNARESELFDAEIVGKASAYDDGQIEKLVASGMPRDAARQQVFLERLRASEGDTGSRPAAVAHGEIVDGVRRRASEANSTTWIDSALAGDAYTPFNKPVIGNDGSFNDVGQVEVDDKTGLLGWVSDKDRRVRVRRADGSYAQYYTTAEDGDAISDVAARRRLRDAR